MKLFVTIQIGKNSLNCIGEKQKIAQIATEIIGHNN